MKNDSGNQVGDFKPVCIGEKPSYPIHIYLFLDKIDDGVFSLLKKLNMASVENLRHYAAEGPEVLKSDFVKAYVESKGGELGTFKGEVLKKEGEKYFNEAFKESPFVKVTDGMNCVNNMIITDEGLAYTDEYDYKINHEFITDERVYSVYKKLLDIADELNTLISKANKESLRGLSARALFCYDSENGKFDLAPEARRNQFLTQLSGLTTF